MESIQESIGRFFDDSVVLDDGRYLGHLAALLADLRPAVLVLATASGTVKAAHLLARDIEPSHARDLVREARNALAQADPCHFATALPGGTWQAFGLRLFPVPDSAILTGVCAASGDSAGRIEALTDVLRSGAGLAWQSIEADENILELRTRVQHFLVEHDTLKAAHTEASIAAIEEQEKRLSEQQDRLAMEQLCAANESANRAKSQFLANMSHEIRTPLSAILGFTELLLNGADEGEESERQEYLETIHSSATHLLELINDILDLSKIEAGRLQIERLPYSPHEIVAGVLSLLRVRAREKGIQLSCEWPDGVPATILTDPLRLKQMLMNLVGNALKFTHRGGVRLVCRLVGRPDCPQMAFDVVDSGIGIAPDKLEDIFDAFIQADNSVTREYGGTGLGLAISRRIARALGGDISVRSEVGKGSTFTVTIDTGPLEDVCILPAPPADGVSSSAPTQPPIIPSILPSRVLLVEDGHTNRKLLTLFLRNAGIEVVTAENGLEGIDRVKQDGFEVILMDMQMPVMDGYTAARELRRLGVTTPIIALTAHAMSGDEQKCLQAGCSAYLSKPVTANRLLAKIADVMASTAAPLADPCQRKGEPLAPAPQSDDTPLLSTLPTEDPEFREIVEEFIEFLDSQLAILRQAYADGDLAELARAAHTLKGTAGTAGFDSFTQPAQRLQQLAKSARQDDLLPALEAVERLAARVVVAGPPTPSSTRRT